MIFEKGRIYIPVFSGLQGFRLKLNQGVRFYREPVESIQDNEIFNLIYNYSIIFDHGKKSILNYVRVVRVDIV